MCRLALILTFSLLEVTLDWEIHIYQYIDVWLESVCCFVLRIIINQCWDHFVCAPSQWVATLQCNVIFHWLGAKIKWSLPMRCWCLCFRYACPMNVDKHFSCRSLLFSSVQNMENVPKDTIIFYAQHTVAWCCIYQWLSAILQYLHC